MWSSRHDMVIKTYVIMMRCYDLKETMLSPSIKHRHSVIMEGDIRKLIFTYSIQCFHTMTLTFDYRKQIVGHYWPQNDKITLQKRCLKIYKCLILIYSFSCCNESQNFRKSWFCDIWCCCYFRRWKNSFKVRILFWKTHTK